ncbi:hypothetical protein [Diaphorobacter ruginosibacter]|nr:hypothetical protein [Diaphorobacter ruginosibacter]
MVAIWRLLFQAVCDCPHGLEGRSALASGIQCGLAKAPKAGGSGPLCLE